MQDLVLLMSFPKKIKSVLCLFWFLLIFGVSSKLSAQGISTGVTFNWKDTQSNLSDAATLDFVEINGKNYNTFVVPSTYEMTRVGLGGHGGNHIWQNGTRLVSSSNVSNWTTEAIKAYQSLNLNHYFESNSNGDNFCGDFVAAATTSSQIQTITYNPGIPSNPDGILAVTERGGNNCQYLELYGIPVGGGTEQLLGSTFVRTSGNLTGVKPQAAPVGNSDYWSSGRNNENGQIIGIGLFELSDIAPVGSIITSIKYYAATSDNGDGKFFLMQTYAVDDMFDTGFNEIFNGDVGANDNVPVGSNYSYFNSPEPLHGTVVVHPDGTFTYTPNPGFVGIEVFEVEVCLPAPNQLVCNTSTVTLNVHADNLPTAIDDSYNIDEDVANNVFKVLDNDDFGLDGPKANTALTINTNPTRGSATVSNNGTPSNPSDDYIVYTPNPFYNGTDSLVYQITDANGTIATANVDIIVNIDNTKSIDITSRNISVNENVGLATITIQIQGNYQVGPIISYYTIENSAIAGMDFNAVSGNHKFVGFDGETFNFTIPIIDDISIESSEVLNIEVSSNSFNSPINLFTDVTIIDNDGNEDWPKDMTMEACEALPNVEDITSASSCPTHSVLSEEITEGQDDQCSTEYKITRTWTVTDCVGNIRNHSQVITIEDTKAPTFVETLPQDSTVSCSEVPQAAVLTAIDTCQPDVEVVFNEVVTNNANCITGYTITRTWSASDCAGNSISHTQEIIVSPSAPISANPYDQEMNILCGDTIPEVPELSFSGGCGDFEVVFNEERHKTNDLDDFKIIRLWEVTDSCGNKSSFQQTIFVMQPQLVEITIDICIEEEAIDLRNYLPQGFDTNGNFVVLEGDVILQGSMFDPMEHLPGQYRLGYSSTEGTCKFFVDFTIVQNTKCVPCGRDDILLSKAVTANGDGVNDVFEIKGAEFCNFSFDVVIYNRWGTKVGEVKDYQNNWGGQAPNGSFGQSGILPTGTYYYIVTATDRETGQILEPFNGYIYLGTD